MTAGYGARGPVSGAGRHSARVESVSASPTARGSRRDAEERKAEWLTAWASALDDLEMNVAQAESLLTPVGDAPEPTAPAALPVPRAATAPAATGYRDARFGAPSPAGSPNGSADGTAGWVALATAGGTGAPSGDWEPPQLPGPLPEELRERAAALLDRQLAAAEALTKAMLGNRQHSGLLERLERGNDEPRSAYVDRAC